MRFTILMRQRYEKCGKTGGDGFLPEGNGKIRTPPAAPQPERPAERYHLTSSSTGRWSEARETSPVPKRLSTRASVTSQRTPLRNCNR